jgi:hypothetical protein
MGEAARVKALTELWRRRSRRSTRNSTRGRGRSRRGYIEEEEV